MPVDTNGQPDTPDVDQTVLGESDSRAISALKRYREKESGSSPDARTAGEGGESGPNPGHDTNSNERERFIPRDRFDEVLQERNFLRQQAQLMQNQQMQAQQHIGPSGMVHQTPETPQPDTPNVPDFDDPEVQKQWRKKLANDPIRGMREFVQMMIQAEGTPMLEQFRNDVMSQLQPVQQAYVQQSVNAYKQSRFQSDPNFTQVAPHFDQVLNQALRERPNLQLDANTMSTLEHIARLQAQQTPNFAPQGGYGQPQPPQPPFTERPGSAQHRAQKQQASTPQLTPAQKRMARTFNMTEQQYAAKLQEMNR